MNRCARKISQVVCNIICGSVYHRCLFKIRVQQVFFPCWFKGRQTGLPAVADISFHWHLFLFVPSDELPASLLKKTPSMFPDIGLMKKLSLSGKSFTLPAGISAVSACFFFLILRPVFLKYSAITSLSFEFRSVAPGMETGENAYRFCGKEG